MLEYQIARVYNMTTGHASSAELYAKAGTDFSSLNWLELKWAAWYLYVGNPVLATGVMSFLLHEASNKRCEALLGKIARN
jgi:hypothetical protein